MKNNKINKGISIVICTYNGAKKIKPTLHHLIQQQFSGLWEIIIVDNASKDDTSYIAREILEKQSNNIDFTILYEPQPGKLNALKLGFVTAKHDYILICDDDNWLKNNYLQEAFLLMEENPSIGVLGGIGQAVFESPPPKWFDSIKKTYAIGSQGKGGFLKKGSFVYGAGSVIRKDAYFQLCELGYHPIIEGRSNNPSTINSGTDTELCLAIQFLGYGIFYSQHLEFKHFLPKERLTENYFRKLIIGMTHSMFILYPYIFSIKKIQYNKVLYWVVSCYLLLKHSIKFIFTFFKKKNSQERFRDYIQFKLFFLFFKKSKVFLKNWKTIDKLHIRSKKYI